MKRKPVKESESIDRELLEANEQVERINAELAEALRRRNEASEGDRERAAARVDTLNTEHAEAVRRVQEIKRQNTLEHERRAKEKRQTKKRRRSAATDTSAGDLEWEAAEAFELHQQEAEREEADRRGHNARLFARLAAEERREAEKAAQLEQRRREAEARARQEEEDRRHEAERQARAAARQAMSLRRKEEARAARRVRVEAGNRDRLAEQAGKGALAVFWDRVLAWFGRGGRR